MRVTVKEVREGICPLCGAAYGYGERDDFDNTYSWECSSCGATGDEGFHTVFDGLYNVRDKDGNELELVELKTIPSNAEVLRKYENFKLFWMKEHGHSLMDLMKGLEAARNENPHATIPELFDEWECNIGFCGAVWPCLHELLSNDEFMRDDWN